MAIASGADFSLAHDLDQFHDVRRAEEVHADDILGSAGDAADLVDVQVGGVRGQQRARPCDPVELAEDALLQFHVLEHGLDHEVALGDRVLVRAAVEQRHSFLDLVGREASADRAALVVAPHRGQAPVESVAVLLDDRYRKPRVGEGHRDAAAHRAGAEHADAANVPDRCVGGDVGNLARRALGEEVVALCPRLRVGMERPRQLGLAGEPLVERQRGRRLDALNADLGGIEPARPAGDPTPEIIEDTRVLPDRRAGDSRCPVTRGRPRPSATARRAKRNAPAARPAFLLAARYRVDEPQFQALPRRLMCSPLVIISSARGHTDQPRQSLSAAAARQDAELDLGQSEPRVSCRPPGSGRPSPSRGLRPGPCRGWRPRTAWVTSRSSAAPRSCPGEAAACRTRECRRRR